MSDAPPPPIATELPEPPATGCLGMLAAIATILGAAFLFEFDGAEAAGVALIVMGAVALLGAALVVAANRIANGLRAIAAALQASAHDD